jgi:putative ABC transport system permease protein
VLISLFGTALGFVRQRLGDAPGAADPEHEGVSTFVLPTGQMITIVGLAVLAGVLDALGPARRAGRLNVLEAIATQ